MSAPRRRSPATRAFALLAIALAPLVAAAGVGAQQRTCDIEFTNTPSTTYDSYLLPSGQRNSFFGGGVVAVCRRDDMTIRADSAEVYGDERRIYLVGNVRYVEPRAKLTSDFLTYYAADERAVAVGNVYVELPSGSTMRGPEATYLRVTPYRPQAELVALGRPTLRLVERGRDGRRAGDPVNVTANAITMRGDSLVYGSQVVEIVRPDLVATGDSLYVDSGLGHTRLMLNPRIDSRNTDRPYQLTGRIIDLYTSDRKLERVRSSGRAIAVSQDLNLRADTIVMRVEEDLLQEAFAWGPERARAVSSSQDLTADSLHIRMPAQRLTQVVAVRKAHAESVPDTATVPVTTERDWLRGDTIVASFDTAAVPGDTARRTRIRELMARHEAASLYHLAPQDTTASRPAVNYVRGQAITVRFTDGKVARVEVAGQSTGLHLEPVADAAPAAAAPASTTPPTPTARPETAPRGAVRRPGARRP